MSSFDSLGLDAPFCDAVALEGYARPTSVQERAIPLLLSGRDVIAAAPTGSGKTAAFGLPLLQRVASGQATGGLVLSPTRELAAQVGERLRRYARGSGRSVVVLHGGVGIEGQVRKLSLGPEVVVATPGRLADLIERGALSLSSVRVLVLDEADRMLDDGFLKDVEALIAQVGPNRQSALFSATMPAAVARLAERLTRDAETLSLEGEGRPVSAVEQRVLYVEGPHKLSLLQWLISRDEVARGLVFVRTRIAAERVATRLAKSGLSAACLHADMPQEERTEALTAFGEGRIALLVATDVAARGLDLTDIRFVFHHDLPGDSDTYVHRVGRSGRHGRSGFSYALVALEDRAALAALEWRLELKIQVEMEHPFLSRVPAGERVDRAYEKPVRRRRPAGQVRRRVRGGRKPGGGRRRG